ncbi:MAG TPA: hypothetical protein VK953_00315 [Methylophilus sp.]|nr:hypothetical protein [Methylophilus sp.]
MKRKRAIHHYAVQVKDLDGYSLEFVYKLAAWRFKLQALSRLATR